jgi:cytidylate kinase
MMASKISAIPEIRTLLLSLQRRMGEKGGVVMEGRDIGTVIFPDAELKVYLTGTIESRSARRLREFEKKDISCSLSDVMADVAQRDRQDMDRAVAPLRVADGGIELDTTHMTIADVLDSLVRLVHKKQATRSYYEQPSLFYDPS